MIEYKMDDLEAYVKSCGDYHRNRFWLKNGKFRRIKEFNGIDYKELHLYEADCPKANERREMELNVLHRYYDEHIRPITDKNTLMSIIINGDGKLKEFIKDQRHREERKRMCNIRKEQKEFLKRTMKSRYAWI